MTDSEFRLDGVLKRNSDSFCLQVESLVVVKHEILCVVGPVGAGKSTLLRLLSGIERPTTGRIEFRGETSPPGSWPLALRRNIVMAPQTPRLLSASVQRNVAYGLQIRGDRQASFKAREALAQLNIAAIAGHDASALSGGQKQLVALARALVIEPAVLLLDEPTAHLDPASVKLVESVITEQQARNRTTIVWATHNLFQARRLAARIAVVLDGTVIEIGSTDKVFNSPQDQRTADFLAGRMVY